MEGILSLLQQYWIVPVGVAILAAPLITSGMAKLKQKISNVKLPKFNLGKGTTVAVDNSDEIVQKDIEAIQWLANRAVDVNDEQLILELESVNKKIFHIHRAMRKPVTPPSAK